MTEIIVEAAKSSKSIEAERVKQSTRRWLKLIKVYNRPLNDRSDGYCFCDVPWKTDVY